MSNNFDVTGFLKGLQSAQPKPREFNQEQKPQILQKVYLSVPENLGKYQVFPMNSTVTGYPFVIMNRTRELYGERIIEGRDPSKDKLYAWFKLLPHSAYSFTDSTGRLVSSLTQAESDLLSQAHATFDTLNKLLEQAGKNKGVTRYKNYTIFNAKCINKYKLGGDMNRPERSNFAALFVCTARDFANVINTNISDSKLRYGGNDDWVAQVYNRLQNGRTGWLIFTISKAANGIAYSVSASHDANLPTAATEGMSITDEEAEVMQDPVKNFLGWQAGDTKNLFNANLIQDLIDRMTKMIVQYQGVGASINNEAVAAAQAVSASQTVAQNGPTTNDPMLNAFQSSQNSGAQFTNPAAVTNDNNSPFVNPPAAQIDPVTQMPVNMNEGASYQNPEQAPYVQPGFAQGFGGGFQPQPTTGGSIPSNNPFMNAPENPYKQ